MNFTTLKFWCFFLAVYALYLILRHRLQNRLLLIASLVFYASWDWRFVPLLLFSILVSFYSGIALERAATETRKRRSLQICVGLEMGILLVFKYFNFFAASVAQGLRSAGFRVSEPAFHVILPLGISYYTFQAVAYTVDVYRGKIKPSRGFLDFALFKSFFPILMSGPIERAGNLLRQIEAPRRVTEEGLRTGATLILWGLFKKTVVSNNLAVIVDEVFAHYGHRTGLETLIGVYAFAIQVYCDFSGYTDIARGLGASMGFDLARNFDTPLFAANAVDFWRRWHISLGLWFRDYLYFPIFLRTRNMYFTAFVTVFLAAMWHGASSSFVFLGVSWGLLTSGYLLIAPHCRFLRPTGAGAKNLVLTLSIVATFHCFCLGAMCIRSESAGQVIGLCRNLFSGSFGSTTLALEYARTLAFFSAPVLVMELFQFLSSDCEVFGKWTLKAQLACFVAIFYVALFSYIFNPATNWSRGGFIYYQF